MRRFLPDSLSRAPWDIRHRSRHSASLLRAASHARPFLVSWYFCKRLLGFSGMVIMSSSARSKGRKIRFRNLVRSARPAMLIRSPIAVSSTHLRKISTWCRLSADFPYRFRHGGTHCASLRVRRQPDHEITMVFVKLKFRRWRAILAPRPEDFGDRLCRLNQAIGEHLWARRQAGLDTRKQLLAERLGAGGSPFEGSGPPVRGGPGLCQLKQRAVVTQHVLSYQRDGWTAVGQELVVEGFPVFHLVGRGGGRGGGAFLLRDPVGT